MATLGVLIIADDPLARAGVATLLADRPGYAVVGQVAGDADLAAAIDAYRPHVALWDLGWEPKRAVDRLADLRDLGLPIVALVPDEAAAAGALNAGARGLLFRDVDGESLIAVVGAVSRGLLVVDPSLATARPLLRERASTPLAEELTPREFEVLQLLAEGLSNKTIADRLNISEHTVKFHVNAILGKLDARSRTEAVAHAARLGLTIL